MLSKNDIMIPIHVDGHELSTPLSSLPSQNPSPLSTDTIIHHEDNAQEIKAEGSWLWEQFSYLIYLALFGILGVLTRYGLQKLFGPEGVGATKDKSYMYLDLPSNMVGSFLMGWFGVVYKAKISGLSDQLAVGLSTGYLGSLTTFSGWDQKMLELGAEGEWLFVVLGYLIGLFLVAYCIIFGIETVKGFRWILLKLSTSSQQGRFRSGSGSKVDSFKIHMVVTVVLLVVMVLFYCLSGSIERKEFNKGGSIANVSAACVMALFAILKKAINTQNFDTVAIGIQFGLMGCLSTVSTFIAEFHNMKVNNQPWRANAYAMVTILGSFIMGTLIYSVPFWINDYD